MKKTILICLGLGLMLSACNTINGAGQDIRSAGQWTSDSAQKVKNKMEQ